ncbi:CRACD-like protein isoform X2 [Heptranchias perlo]|uniref:CRACD-like protein isoform X2 n=1 Tax=Heptranchias perlo TaxID=212740 RepID=UPI003559742F
MATGLTDAKMHEAEGPSEDGSGKKKSKFKSFKKLFVKKKKKELISHTTKNSLKQSQSASDVTSPESRTLDLDSEDELSAHKSIMGTRALSHDSIFIPDTSAQQPVKSVRVFSQENVSGPIRALQLKVQQNIKLVPPPMSIPAKRMEDTGASSEDDGLPRSPPETSPLHEALARGYLAKYFYKNHSSLTLGGTGSEEEEQISPGPSSRPNSPLSTVIQTRSTSRSWSPTSPLVHISSSDSSASPAIDFNSPPTFSICLDSSAARHKLSVKPRNQRSATKGRRRPSRLLSNGSCELIHNVPELKEENEQEIIQDNAENAIAEINLKERTESPSTVLTPGQSLILFELTTVVPSSAEAVDTTEQRSGEFTHIDVTGQQDIAASHSISDVSDHLKTCSIPAVISETGEDVTLMDFDILEVTATQNAMLPGTEPTGSTIVLSKDSSPLDFIDPLKQKEEINLWEAQVKSTACDTRAVSVNTSFTKETVYQTRAVIQTDILSLDSEKPSSSTPAGTEISEGEFVQETLDTYFKQTKMAATTKEPFIFEACSTKQAARELSNHEDMFDKVPEKFSSIALTHTPEVYSQAAETSKTSKELPVSETVTSSLENPEMTVFKEVNIKISQDKSVSQQSSFKKNSQGSFKFSISSAWNRSRSGSVKWNEDDLTADPDTSHKTFPQKAITLLGKEKKEKDEEMSLPEPSGTKIDAHKQEKSGKKFPEKTTERLVPAYGSEIFNIPKSHDSSIDQPCENIKTEEAQGKGEDGRGLFGVKLRSTSRLKYKESSHSEYKETVKRHSAEAALDSDGSALQPKAEKTDVKKPPEVSLSNTLKDDGKMKTKSSESLAVKPPLPKKPVLQNVNTSTIATDKPNKPVRSTQERLKDTEKKSSVSKNSEQSVEILQDGNCEEEKGQPFAKNTQDTGLTIEGSSVPAWVTMARQKQKGYHVQHVSKEEKMPAQEVKAIADKQGMNKETTKPPTELQSSHQKSLSSCKPPQDGKLELKSSATEPQQKVSPMPSPVTVNKHSSATPQNTSDKEGRDQHSKDKISPSSSQPSWMELAKKKAKAWSDMPQIIK